MKIIYANEETERQCTSKKDAMKLFGGNSLLVQRLFHRIEMIEQAEVIKDIIVFYPFHFHKLTGSREGDFAIDVKSRKDKWRIILRPMDENEQYYNPCHIDEIASTVTIVEIREVSAHYE